MHVKQSFLWFEHSDSLLFNQLLVHMLLTAFVMKCSVTYLKVICHNILVGLQTLAARVKNGWSSGRCLFLICKCSSVHFSPLLLWLC